MSLIHFLSAPSTRTPCVFSEAITPARTMVTGHTGAPIGLGNIIARNTIAGKLTGYVVALDSGQRITILPSQISSPENIAAPAAEIWFRKHPGHPRAPFNPPGAA